MSIEVVKAYDDVVARLQEKHSNVDPFLLLKSSMLTRKYPRSGSRGSGSASSTGTRQTRKPYREGFSTQSGSFQPATDTGATR